MSANFQLSIVDSIWKCEFAAMASPCEVLFSTDSAALADKFSGVVCEETKRIEAKFSRYVSGNIIHQINNSQGAALEVDEETARLLDFADRCFQLSDGLFDITSGVLRKCWTFDGSEQAPDAARMSGLLALVGWGKISWKNPCLRLVPGMQIDFGGIGKEYAVDRVAGLAAGFGISKVMVNFGGDIRTINPDLESAPWVIGIESPDDNDSAIGTVEIHNGGIATSGDSSRYCLVNGKRVGHILNPQTGWPIEGAPRSVTVISSNCTQAGMIATMAILQRGKAEEFLESQEVTYKCIRG